MSRFSLGSLANLAGSLSPRVNSHINTARSAISQAQRFINNPVGSLASSGVLPAGVRGVVSAVSRGDSIASIAGSPRTPLISSSANPNSWLAKAAARSDPLFEFSWDAMLVSPLGVYPHEYIEDITVPMPRFDMSNVVMQASKYYYASFLDYGTASVKFYEDFKADITQRTFNWASLIRAPNGDYEVPSKYKGTLYVWIKDPTNWSNLITFRHVGVFPTNMDGMNLGSQGGRIQMTMELAVDRVELS